jgi:hypothetical protein
MDFHSHYLRLHDLFIGRNPRKSLKISRKNKRNIPRANTPKHHSS